MPIYLYKSGYSISIIVFFYFLISLYFLIFSILGVKIVSKVGVKHSILFSIPFLILYYFLLREVNTYKYLIFILPLFLSFSAILYNYGFHLNYIQHSDKRDRGKEISILYIVSTIATALGPFIGGLIIYYFNFNILFINGIILLLIGVSILFIAKETYEKRSFNIKNVISYLTHKRNRGNILSFSGYAIESIISRVLWPIYLIIILVTVKKVGLIVTSSLIFSIILFYFAGKVTDKYNKSKIITLISKFYFLSWIGRIFANSAILIFSVDTYKNILEKFLYVAWGAKSYDIASKEDYFMFIVAREIIFNLSRIIILPIIILLFYYDIYPFIISFIIASVFSLLYPMLRK